MPKATAICNSVLGIMYRAAAWANVADNAASAPLSSVYLGLHTATLTPATGTQTENEIAYTNYARKQTARSSVDWSAPSGGQLSNVQVLQFPACGATGGSAHTTSTGTASSGAGAVWHFGALNFVLAIGNGITPQFNIGAYVIQET
jgi:hypothetical protein